MNHTGGKSEQGYAMEVTLDADKILATANLDGQPQSFREFWEQGLEQSAFTLSLSLPASEIADASGEAALDGAAASVTVPVRFDGPTELRLVTRVHYSGGRLVETPSGDAAGHLQRGYAAALIALCVFAALAICFVAAACLRKRRSGQGKFPPGNMQA